MAVDTAEAAMMLVGGLLALLMGIVLGLLGGGGSILTVPILVYACGLEAKPAIATSLLVVAITSAVAVVQHARHGNVLWAKGLLFGGFAMLGALGGGWGAAVVPGWLLLVLFAGMMLVTAVAMLRGNGETGGASGRAPASLPGATWKVALEGLVVGAFTGLVGAGGGFLVVPALVLLGGLSMRAAVGTSLLVIALKSSAGLAGYLSHVAIDPVVAAVVTTAAIVGSLLGARATARVDPDAMRTAFAWLVLLMGGVMLYQEIGMDWSGQGVMLPLGGGALIGLAAALVLLWNGRIAGISGIVAGLLRPAAGEVAWRATFVAGLLAGGALLAVIYPQALAIRAPASFALVALAGVLVGYGTRLGSGCTSGHGVCGVSRLAPRSLLATMTFMATGALTVYLVHSSGGGTP